MAAELDVVAYLATKGYQPRRANSPEVVYPCMFCGEPASSRKRKLYLNTETGLYNCKVCNQVGGSYLLQQHFGDDPKVRALPHEDLFTRRCVLVDAAKVGTKMLRNNDDALLYLLSSNDIPGFGEGRGLSPDTIEQFGLGYVGGNWSLVGDLQDAQGKRKYTKETVRTTGLVYRDGPRVDQDFFYSHILIPYQRRGVVDQIRGRAVGKNITAKYVNGPGTEHLLFNADDLDGAEDVIITEGEFDCMILKQELSTSPEDRVRRFAVCGVAGTGAIPTNIENLLASVKRVYIGFDPDEPGKKAAIKLKEQLGTKARIIELPVDEKKKIDWTELIARRGWTWREVMHAIGSASGKRVHTMRESGIAFRTQRTDHAGIKTGYELFDAAILPGLLPGQLMVVLAKTGTGKTIFCCNLAYYMRHHKVLIVSLEMTREEVYHRLQRIYLFHNPSHTEEVLEHALANIGICDENRLSTKDFAELLDEFEVEMGGRPEVVLVDYLGYFARGVTGTGPYEKTTNGVMDLKALAKSDDPSKRFVCIAPHQVKRLAKEGKPIDLDDARDSGVVEETADFLVSIYRPDDALTVDMEPSGRLKLAVLKSRHGGKDRVFTLQMDLLTLAICDADTKPAARAREHNRLHTQGMTWDSLRAKELAPVQPQLHAV